MYYSCHTCFLVPYTMILCFADMCAAWFSIDCYTWIHDRKYSGYSLHQEYRNCFLRMLLLTSHRQATYTFLKMWPSLVIGSILREFLSTVAQDLDNRLKQTTLLTAETATVVGPVHAMLRFKLAGLWIIMGNPISNINASTASWFCSQTRFTDRSHWHQ